MTLEQKETLDKLVSSYGGHNAEKTKLDKICKQENEQIKSILGTQGEHTAGGYKAIVSTTPNESMNEAKLLELLHKHKVKGVIKTREYVDFDALEGMIYNGQFSADVLAEFNTCKTSKPVTKLYIKKVKEEK